MPQKKRLLIFTLLLVVFNKHSLASDDLVQSFQDNLRWSADFSTRAMHFNGQNQTANMQFIGFDIHSVLSGSSGDIGVLVLQSYLIRVDNLNPPPAMFSDEHDWALSYRSFNFNYKNTCSVCPNVRIGHYILPFGLEYTIDTAGEVRDFNHRSNLGLKMDWGISLNKQHRQFEYEFSYSLGSGDYLRRTNNQRVISGRIGSLRSHNWAFGLSYANANLAQTHRQKTAIDIKHYRGLWGYLFEFSKGSEKLAADSISLPTKDLQLEVNWRDPQENWLLYSHLLYKDTKSKTNKRFAVLGMRYDRDANWSTGLKLSYPLHDTTSQNTPWVLTAQLRYRY